MRRPAACLFDLDGLLLDTEPLHSAAWQQASQQFGLQLSLEQLLALRGRRRLDCAEQVRGWIADAGLPVPSTPELLAIRQPIAEQLLPKARPIPGACELVAACQLQSIPMAMVTSSSRAAVALKAAPHPWLSAIVVRVHGDDPHLGAGKPEPDPYLLAADRLGVPVEQCWAFEDSLAGAQSALAAGCIVHVLVPTDGDEAAQLAATYLVGCKVIHALSDIKLPA